MTTRNVYPGGGSPDGNIAISKLLPPGWSMMFSPSTRPEESPEWFFGTETRTETHKCTSEAEAAGFARGLAAYHHHIDEANDDTV